ncbi:hypothetical protein Tco_0493677 [Tanacetum coccineum]
MEVENMISNEFAVKLCLDHEVKRGNKVVKKELIVALRGEIYFVKFIINPEEDNVEPGVVLGRSFMRLTKGIADCKNKTITIYPKLDPFLDSAREEEKIGDDWDLLLDDLDFGDILDIKGVEIPPFVCKMGKRRRSLKRGTGHRYLQKIFSTRRRKTKKEDHGAFMIPIRLEGKINLNALADTGSDINVMPYRIYKELGREELKNVNKGIYDVEPFKGGAYGAYEGCPVPAKTSLDTTESDSDDEEEYAIQRNKFGAPIYGPKPVQYLNCNDPMDRSLALQAVLNPFRKVCVWKKVVSFLGSLPVPLQHVDWKPNYTRCFNKNEDGDGQWHVEIRLTDPYENIYDQGFVTKKTSRRLWERMTVNRIITIQTLPTIRDGRGSYASMCPSPVFALGKVINEMLTIKLCVAGTNEDIYTLKAWTNAFNIDEQIYSELCHEFYSTYEFDEVCVADELKTKKIIKFRLCGHAFSWTLLEFEKRLGLYNSEEIEEEGFDVYFQGGLRSDEHFNAQEYWLSISREENLSLSRSHASIIRNPVLRVLHKMITYGLCQRTTRYDKIQKNDLSLLSMFDARNQNGYANVAWLISRWMKRKEAGSQKESMICCGQFIMKIAKRKNLLSEEVLNSLSALIYCRALDTTTLRELIDSEGRLIPEAPKPGVPRVVIPRPPRASMQDLYERMGSMKIRQGEIERIVPLQGAYNPPGYDQQQYDQYYQQYPPQQQQQQPDDNE